MRKPACDVIRRSVCETAAQCLDGDEAVPKGRRRHDLEKLAGHLMLVRGGRVHCPVWADLRKGPHGPDRPRCPVHRALLSRVGAHRALHQVSDEHDRMPATGSDDRARQAVVKQKIGVLDGGVHGRWVQERDDTRTRGRHQNPASVDAAS